MDLDPIKQLQQLLDDRGKVLEKISGIRSALGSIVIPNAPAPEPLTPSSIEAHQAKVEIPTGDTLGNERVLRALRDMQGQIEERIRPLAQDILQSEVARLRSQSVQDRGALERCLAQIDRCILTFVEGIGECEKHHATLNDINERLVALGVEAQPIPAVAAPRSLNQVIQARIDALRKSGQL